MFLINPNGIVFGEDASLDLGGSFISTTADAVQFGEQRFFSASDPQMPPLLTIQPSAFVFNQLNANPIINNSIAEAGIDPVGNDTFGLRVSNELGKASGKTIARCLRSRNYATGRRIR